MVSNLPLTKNGSEVHKDAPDQYVVFLMDGQHYALALREVIRIVRAVEITRLPDAPAIVLGVVNVEGELIPVFNLRRRFLLPEREVCAQDQFLIASMGQRKAALVIDEAQGVIERQASEIVASDTVVPGLEHVRGMVKLDDGLVLIQDLEMFLSLDEAQSLQKSMEKLK
jgi:purine-binding chemotaxis protein CheW